MAANATATKKTTQSSTASARKDERGIDTAVAYVRQTAERAVDVPVGAALIIRDRVEEAIEPWTSENTREKELKTLRTQVTRELNKFERRGGQARRKTTQRVRSTRNRVEREVKARRREVEKTVRQNRRQAETQLRKSRREVESQLKKARKVVEERVPTLAS